MLAACTVGPGTVAWTNVTLFDGVEMERTSGELGGEGLRMVKSYAEDMDNLYRQSMDIPSDKLTVCDRNMAVDSGCSDWKW